MEAALLAGSDLVGLVAVPQTPRFIDMRPARALAQKARGHALITLLTVNASDDFLQTWISVVKPDVLQLHGAEPPERVLRIRKETGLEVIKALNMQHNSDPAEIAAYHRAASLLLFDAPPPADAGAMQGGHGQAFDWNDLKKLDPSIAFMLSGGLKPENVAKAISATKCMGVDVSSGVEQTLGEKSPAKIAAFVASARSAFLMREQKHDGSPA